MAQETALRRGYLREDFRLFHLKDAAMEQVDWHYHSFHKVLVLLSGHASYTIEGQNYALEPGDVVFVPAAPSIGRRFSPGWPMSGISCTSHRNFSAGPLLQAPTWKPAFNWPAGVTATCSGQVGSFTQFACWRRCTAPNSPQGMGRTCWATLFCFNFSFPSPGSWKHILGCTQLPPPVTRRLSPF